jgi:dienelactone hydrolase
MGNRVVRILVGVGVWGGAVACQPGRGAPGGATIDDHDHLTAVATVEAMDGRAAGGVERHHLRMLGGSPAGTSVDSARADLLVLEMRDALGRYRDIAAATADGFENLETATTTATADSVGITHLVNWKWAVAEAFRFNPTKPTALVYRTGRDGAPVLLGAMYTAPDGATSDALDRRVPVRIGRWHQHVDWCTPKRGDDARWTETGRDGAPMFGPGSRIATRQACDSVAGAFHPHVFGWMVHANVFASDEPGVIWNEPVAAADSAAVVKTAVKPKDAEVRATPSPAPARAPAPAPAPDTALPAAHPGFASGEARVTYERFMPAKGGGRHAAVIILHGGSGMGADSASEELRASAGALATRGYVTEIVHYFDATGTTTATLRSAFTDVPTWNRTIGDAITQVASDPSVDATRIALLGVGLGGRLAILHAAEDPRVRCVVDYFGGIGDKGARRITRMPPVDVVGMEGDAEVTTLHDLLTRLNVRSELHIYPGRAGAMAPSDRRDAGQGAEKFLETYLSPK